MPRTGSWPFSKACDYADSLGADVLPGKGACADIGIIRTSAQSTLCRYRHKVHLLQRCKELQQKHPHSPWGPTVEAVLQAGLDVRDRCRNGELTRHGLDSLRGRLEARLGRLIDAPPPLKDAKRFAKHLANEFPVVFLFLRDPSIDATNWRAEQAIRPAVVIRKVCGGNRTRKPPTPSRCSRPSCVPPASGASTCQR